VYPPPKRAIATLVARGGRAFEEPRWFADGRRLLISRATRRQDGSLRPDLYEWNVETRSVRRLTKGAGVRDADPSPDGDRAVALRCGGGQCDVVVVTLRTGAMQVIVAGDTIMSYAHPRFAPDGRTVAVARHRDDRWRVVLLDVAGGPPRLADPDDGANRFDPAWIGPATLVVTSDREGTANLERIDLSASGAPSVRQLTRVTGAAVAPAPNRADGSIWFLSLQSHGYDVRRLPGESGVSSLSSSPLVDARLTPVSLTRSAAVRRLSARELPPAHRYEVGARVTRWLPLAAVGADGRAGGIAIANSDVVGRLAVLAQGVLGNGGAWRGASIDMAWRAQKPSLRASAFLARGSAGTPLLPVGVQAPIVTLTGGELRADWGRAFDMADVRFTGGFSPAWLERRAFRVDSTTPRPLGFGEIALALRQTGDRVNASESISMNGAAGSDGSSSFQRGVASFGVRVGAYDLPALDLSATYGRVSAGAAAFERFSVGGLPSTLVDPLLLTQRLPMPALPLGVTIGDRALVYRAATRLAGFSPYYWGGSGRNGAGRFEKWNRVIGIELVFDQGPQAVLGTPGGRITAGIGHSLDEPFADRTRAYVTVALRP
jgi:hypothetical protein